MKRLEPDVFVVGGGPAGALTAALLRKYNPSMRVLLAEGAAYPRYHIGESLVLEVNRVLADAGVLPAVEKAGFLRKGGATYVWGADRKPWAFYFRESTPMREPFAGMEDYTFHVDRARFDELLLDHARGMGVEVLQPAKVTAVHCGGEAGDRPERFEVAAPGGDVEIVPRFTVDASGRAGVVSRRLSRRVFDPVLRNVATFGYWQGAKLEREYSLDWDLATIAIVSLPTGWLWYIPMGPGLVSVGVVRPAGEQKEIPRDELETFYRNAVRSAPEPARWLADAELVEAPGAPRKVMVEHDFNYLHDRLWGSGWAAVGDAGGFLDPLFTFGVFLSATGAQLLAYSIGTFLDGRHPEATPDRLLTAYEQHMRGYFSSFRAMLYTFYGFNSTKEAFWQQTRELMRSHALPADVSDRDAFLAMTFGFGVNSLLFREATSHFGHVALNRIRDMLLDPARAETHLNQTGDYGGPALAPDSRPKLEAPYALVPSAIPIEGSGRMVPMTRVDFSVPSSTGASFPRHFYVPDPWLPLLEQLDGRRTVGEIARTAAARPLPGYLRNAPVDRFVNETLRSMMAMGVVRAGAGATG
jgi:flavin-dependent dehydrogenase